MAYTTAAAIHAATGEIGYRESGTNKTKFNTWLGPIGDYPHGGYGYPWCASFMSWVANKAGGRANVDYPRTAGCASAVSWFRAHGRWTSTPHVGDWVLYGPGGGTHVELVTAVSGSSITTIGGNTSGSLSGQYFNGDGVYRKLVSRGSDRIYGYGRPIYQEDDDMPLSDSDIRKVAEAVRVAVCDADKAPAPAGTDAKRNPTWRPVNLWRDTYTSVEQIKKAVGALAAQTPDVDEDAIAAAVLASLTPESIAAAIPAELAEQVVTALGARLTPKES